MATQHTALVEVQRFTQELQALGLTLRQVILFGSYARNEQHDDSDIDLAIVADEFSGFRPEDVRLFLRPLARHVDIEPHTFRPEDFTDWNPFVQEIKRTGIRVV